jgi:hypothetical protein
LKSGARQVAARGCVAADSVYQEMHRHILKRHWQYFADLGSVPVLEWHVMLTAFVLMDAEYRHIYNGDHQETSAAIHQVVCAHKAVEEEPVFVQLLLTLIAATPLQDFVQQTIQDVAELSVINV